MSRPYVVWKDDLTGKIYRTLPAVSETDVLAGTLCLETHDRKGSIIVRMDQIIRCTSVARNYLKLTNVPCYCDGYGADVSEYFLVQELREERAAGTPKPDAYVEWRQKYIASFEANGPTLEQLQKAYPNVPGLK